MNRPKYHLFPEKEQRYTSMSPIIKNAIGYAERYMKWAPVEVSQRAEVARLFGWIVEGEESPIKDEVKYLEYQTERACLLFPDAEQEIRENIVNLNVAEVDRAEANFSKDCQIPFVKPVDSLSLLANSLTEIAGNTAAMEALNWVNTQETDSKQSG